MEAVAFALAVYPALVLTLEQYEKGFKKLQDWIRFREKYNRFAFNCRNQQLRFNGIIEDLLCGGSDPLLFGDSREQRLHQFLYEKYYHGWKDPNLAASLKHRLDERYDWCIETIAKIGSILDELSMDLAIQDVNEPHCHLLENEFLLICLLVVRHQ
jgi:hypothetical protein